MKTILVVDDNKLNLTAVRNALKDTYRVISVLKGQQALTYLESGECDLILLDINMPDMDGFEVMEKIRSIDRCRSTPVVFLTADRDAETEARCFRMGAMDFIAKPFIPAVMMSRIGRILEIEDLRRSFAERLERTTQEVYAIRNKAQQDALTGLWNRVYTEETVNRELERGTQGALLMIDIDNFKPINDQYGHIAGDKTLKAFAGILRDCSADEDILCRIGGDEFVVFVKNVVSKSDLSQRAADIISAMQRRMDAFGFGTETSVSIGIAQAPQDGKTFLDLYSCADKALYFVKQNGKKSYHFFSDRVQQGEGLGGRTVDLRYLQDLMSRADSGMGAYLLDFENFHHVYNFIRRFIDRSNRDVQTLLFTVSEAGNGALDAAEAEFVLELLEKAVYTSLRRSDVSTRYSSKQIIVILMDANNENGDMVAGRIVDSFYQLYKGGKARIEYGIARLDSRGKK